MVVTEAPRQVGVDAACAAEALALSVEPGWNQCRADWALMLGLGTGCGYRTAAGSLVATALALPYGDAIGWISMVLVTASWRRRGLATALLGRCVEALEADGRVPVLDATAAGALVYARQGFEPRLTFTRWRRPPRAARAPSTAPPASAGRAVDPGLACALDAEVFGSDRGAVLRDLVSRSGRCQAASARGTGMCLSRDGRTARQVGPLSAASEPDAVALLEGAITAESGELVVDALDDRPGFRAALERAGFAPERSFTRMVRGASALPGDCARAFAVAGPELG